MVRRMCRRIFFPDMPLAVSSSNSSSADWCDAELGLTENQMDEIEEKLKQIAVIRPKEGRKKTPIPSPVSINDALSYYLDFLSVPRPALLMQLASLASDEDAQYLRYLAEDNKGREELAHNQYSLLEILERCAALPLEFVDLVELCPKLQPRLYTISSSSKASPKQLSLTVTLSAVELPNSRRYLGHCSSYLCSLKPGDQVCMFVRISSFRLPARANTPVIMVGPGTGVAPFRAFVEESAFLRSQIDPATGAHKSTLGKMSLYFGCRKSDEDFIYEDEMQQALASGALDELHLAFSRQFQQHAVSHLSIASSNNSSSSAGAPSLVDSSAKFESAKVYVQDRVAEHRAEIWRMLNEQRGHMFVCGGTLMGRAIREQLISIAKSEGNLTDEQAADWFKRLQSTEHRYNAELWS